MPPVHARSAAVRAPARPTGPARSQGASPADIRTAPPFLGALAAAICALSGSACFLTTPLPASAAPRLLNPTTLSSSAAAHSIVRVQDVESPTMRAGLVAANDGRLADAERLFKIALRELEAEGAAGGGPSSIAAAAAAHSNLGNVLLQEGRTQAALQELDAAVNLAPQAAVPLLNRSLALEQLAVEADGGEPSSSSSAASPKAAELLAAALRDATAACAADPTEAAAFFDAGGILQRLGRTAEAAAAFSTAADLAPGLPGYRLRAGTLLFETGDLDGAARAVRGVARRAPTYGEAHAASAAVAWAAGEGGRAEAALDAALNLDAAWKSEAHVREVTRWPPKLVAAYGRLLRLEGPGPVGPQSGG